ncbi:TfoX/Sxy family protein [Ornithinimicrobium pratense]|uniref:TfoX/Sxy family protein n=1 Tax=Ornithinimicrobium pratense TaxID=2593973 RepID=A0A5J6V6M4_9MICO|nr:TfoX/Sxy family protein [Ornithinimicrobium pratense]QFG69670.1 TfoX/Sxy family protein [Ornithinimicrobium pratense]
MAYDEGLAQRVRALLQDEADVTEKRMFGGLAFLLAGHMAVAVGEDGLMFRIEPGTGEAQVGGHVREQVMGERVMTGWLHADTCGLATEDQLRAVVDRGKATTRALPPK